MDPAPCAAHIGQKCVVFALEGWPDRTRQSLNSLSPRPIKRLPPPTDISLGGGAEVGGSCPGGSPDPSKLGERELAPIGALIAVGLAGKRLGRSRRGRARKEGRHELNS